MQEIFEVAKHDTSPPEKISDTQSLLQGMIEEARNYYQAEIEPEQSKATDYYMGRKFGGGMEEEGRSQVVSTDVRDTVQAVLPSLMRIFKLLQQHYTMDWNLYQAICGISKGFMT